MRECKSFLIRQIGVSYLLRIEKIKDSTILLTLWFCTNTWMMWGAFQSPDVFKRSCERVVFLAGRLGWWQWRGQVKRLPLTRAPTRRCGLCWHKTNASWPSSLPVCSWSKRFAGGHLYYFHASRWSSDLLQILYQIWSIGEVVSDLKL